MAPRHTSSCLPLSWRECKQRGWQELDVLLVTGDAYIDHPSFGIALIGRLLESEGLRVALLSQPRHHSTEDFAHFPPPRLFCGITAGNLDSIVANYTGNGRVRKTDSYSPHGNPWRGKEQIKTKRRRPDRATIVYSSLARSAFPGTPIVLGGIEASLRRFIHYDYQQDKLRNSFLLESKGDLLIYGMGEKAILEVVKRRQAGNDLSGIAGTCERLTEKTLAERFPELPSSSNRATLLLPSWSQISQNRASFLDAEIEIDKHARARSSRLIFQKQKNQWIVQHPPQPTLRQTELDQLYQLPFTRRPHPDHVDVPAFRMIRDSITIVRGCSGNCSFCAITRHQGGVIVSRSHDSIVREAQQLASARDFSGTISDLGGPTANLYGTHCKIGGCRKRDCLYPELCPNLEIDEDLFLKLLKEVSSIEGINHLFISSGLRMGLLLQTPKLLARLMKFHTPGMMKIAPEHTVGSVLQLMHKEPHDLLVEFIRRSREIAKQNRLKPPQFSPYIITAHPGSNVSVARKLADQLKTLKIPVHSFQDFTPTPGTLSTAIYYTGIDPSTRKKVSVPKTRRARQEERAILEKSFTLGKKGREKKKR